MSEGGQNTTEVTGSTQGVIGQPQSNLGASDVSAKFCWRNRRRMLWLTTIFCMLTISYILYTGASTSVADTAVTMAFFTIMSMVGSYVFGAAWQDITAIRTLKK